LTALLLRLGETRKNDDRFSELVNKPGIPLQEIEPDPGTGLQEVNTESLMDPGQDLLFFVEPEKLKQKSVFILGTGTELEKIPGTGEARDSPGLDITDMKGIPWGLRPGLISLREDGSSGKPRSWKPGGPPAPVLPVSSDPDTALKELLTSDTPPVTVRGEPWSFRKAETVNLHFEALLSAENEEPLYEPFISLGTAEEQVYGSLMRIGDSLIILEGSRALAACVDNTGDYLWFIRLMLSRKVLNASDIRARFSEIREIPGHIRVEIPQLPENLRILSPALVLEISGRNGTTDFLPRWRYGDVLIFPENKSSLVTDTGQSRIQTHGLRNPEEEQKLLDKAEQLLLSDLSWQRGPYSRLSGDSSTPLRLEIPLDRVLSEYGPALIDSGVEIRLENRPVRKSRGLQIQARQHGSILELNTLVVSESGTEALNIDEWFEKGGLAGTGNAFFTLTGKDLEQLAFLRNHGMDNSGFLSTSPDNLSLIDAVYSEIEADEETVLKLERKRSIYKSLSDFSPDKSRPPPEDFNGELRPYQTHGYAWLLHLRNLNIGGCLADDMGLGKTVQTLAYLSRLKADGKLGGSLLAGPVVTLSNWEAEIRRFAPGLRYHRYAGPAGKRYIPGDAEKIDLIIVSYQTLRNDIERFLDRDWDHIILDEAHYVKNSSSLTFKAVRSINAAHRLSLTGTPLENHLNELWSQMTFLNPGLLGSRQDFIRRYVKPVEKDGNEEVLNRLSDTVAPFILRRKKSEVLNDLPPKDETVIRCEMTPGQADAYHAARNLYYRQVSGLLSREGLAGARIQIFTILSKLRLLAIHPPLAGEQFSHISSGKMAVLDNLMEEILEEDHKTLVFSQFLGALDRAQETCREHDWRFSRLTGATRNRDTEINRFRDDPDTRVFLLSLKAGGVGINLTAADYVILLDPWWNPAVEAQAVDRAHRMGQTRPVMAYRLITTGTIEEKVLEMQEKKRNLIAGVLGEGENPNLNEEEILTLLE
jgi:superfamily II DNA or RNA helicase